MICAERNFQNKVFVADCEYICDIFCGGNFNKSAKCSSDHFKLLLKSHTICKFAAASGNCNHDGINSATCTIYVVR